MLDQLKTGRQCSCHFRWLINFRTRRMVRRAGFGPLACAWLLATSLPSISRSLACTYLTPERSSKMSPSDSSPAGFGMAVFFRVACVAALTPTTHAVIPQHNVNNRRESAFASPPGSLRTASIAQRGWCYTGRRSSTTPAAAGVRPHPTRPLSRRGRHGHTCSHHNNGGAIMLTATSSDRADTAAQQTTATTATVTSVDSPAAAVLAAHGMRKGDWEALIRAGEVMSLKEGELLMSQGDSYDEPGDRLIYLTVSGGFGLEIQGKPAARIQVGDFVGEGV